MHTRFGGVVSTLSLFASCFLCGGVSAQETVREAGPVHVLENAKVRLALDARGRLSELVNVQTGNRYAATSARAPWRMFYRSEAAPDLEIRSEIQDGRVTRDGHALVVSYRGLKGNTPRAGQLRNLRVDLTIRISLDDDRLDWRAAVENHETDQAVVITELWLPWIYGIGDLGLGPESDVLYWPERLGRRIPAPYEKLMGTAPSPSRDGRSYRMTYPFPASMQWFTVNNGEEGIYIGSHDKTLMASSLNVMAHRGRGLSASVIKYPFVKPSETWNSEPVLVRLYRGDWHGAADTYRAWAEGWMQPAEPPAWIRRANGWVVPVLKSQSGSRISFLYSELPPLMRDAQKIGINIMNWFGWVKQGFDNRYPEYDIDEAMGGEAALRKALTDIARGGGKVFLYTQGQLIDPTTEFYRAKGHRMTAKDIWGYEYREMYDGAGNGTLLQAMRNKWFGIACPQAPGWLDQLIAQYEMVRGLGAQGVFYDQLGGIAPYLCYSDAHGHAKPSLAVGPGKVHNMRRLRELIKSRDPEFGFVFELATDCYAPWVDMIHGHGVGFWPEPDAFAQMFRYTFPEPILINRAGGPYGHRAQFGNAFALGLRFDISPEEVRDSEIAQYLARLVKLRNTFADLLLEGRFVDDRGFLSDNRQVAAYGYVSGNRLAVTLWNPTAVPQKVRIVAPGKKLEAVQWQQPAWEGPEHMLLPDDVAVWVFGND